MIFNKRMQEIRTCGYSNLSRGKSSNGNFEVLCITLMSNQVYFLDHCL